MAAAAQLAQMKTLGVGLCGPRTDIDRRQCHRVVPMKVLCLGMPRTGTSSIRMALMQLGFADVYHMVELWEENPRDDAPWIEAYRAKFEGVGKPYGREEFDRLLGHCMAISDIPPISFTPELIDAYPDAKVILTVRDTPSAWHKSMLNTIWTGAFILGPPTSFPQWLLQQVVPRPQAWRTVQYAYKYTIGARFEEEGVARYEAHNQMVRDLVPGKGRLLEFNVKQGWGPLCEFLGVEEPEGLDFPRVNDGESWRRHVLKSKMRGVVNLVGALVGLGVLVTGVIMAARGWGH